MGKRVNTAKWMDQQKRWQINVQKDGERRSFYSSTPGRTGQRECNAKADAWLDDNISETNSRVSRLFEEYIETLKLTTSKGNWSQIESIGKNWVAPNIGNKKIGKLNEQHLQHIINQAYASGKSRKTIKNIRHALSSFLKYCRKRKLTNLILEDLSIPKSASYKEKKILQPADLKKLFSTDTTILRGKRVFEKYIYAFRFQVLVGLRPGELLGLKWNDVQDGQLFIRRAINQYGTETAGKNKNALRNFVIPAMGLEILKAQKALTKDEEFIFGIISQSGYEKRLTRYCESNGIESITPYELRHTFVSIGKTLPEGQIKALVGHSKNMDTFGVYGHEVNGEGDETAEKINSIFSQFLSK